MSGLLFFIVCIGFFVASLLGTQYFQRYAARKGLIDHPNHRSSHSNPTPSGGGLVIVLLANSCWLLAMPLQLLTVTAGLTLFIAGSAIALVGYIDDHGGISRWTRLLVQLITIVSAVALLYPYANLGSLYLQAHNYPWITIPLVIFSLLWLTNLYNFMDGIDGIAASQAIAVLASVAIALYIQGDQKHAALAILYGVIISGFIVWNWPPAKIFMGDIGSTYIGLTLGLLALIYSESLSLWFWIIILGCFVGDASWTLITRIMTKQNWRDGHRLHAYQKITTLSGKHKTSTLLFTASTLFWLAPLAMTSVLHPENGPALASLAYLPIFFICWKVSAGKAIV